MGLTDTSFLIVLVVGTAAGFGLAVWLTGRWHSGLGQAVGRAGMIALVAVLSLTCVGVWLNNANGWYASWDDLFGAVSAQSTQTKGAAAALASEQQVGGSRTQSGSPAPTRYPPLPQPGSRIQRYTWHGPASGVTTEIDVILPPSYQEPGSAKRRYPVIEAFHGIPGTPSGWTKTMGLPDELAQAFAQQGVAESVAVIPQLAPSLGQDRECVNGPPGSPQLETWLAVDVPDFVRTHFRVADERAGWATLGYSAGGWCAAMVAVLHPDQFGAAGVLSGYFTPDFGNGPPWPANSAQAHRYDLTAQVSAHPPALAMWLQSGRQSPYWPQTAAFLAAVKPPMSVTSVVMADSGHRWDVWKAQVPVVLKWLGTNIPGFRP